MLALEATSRLRRDHREPAALVLAATPGREMDVVMRAQLAGFGERQGAGRAALAGALAEFDRAIDVLRRTGSAPKDLAPQVAPLFPAYLGQSLRSWFAVDTHELARPVQGTGLARVRDRGPTGLAR